MAGPDHNGEARGVRYEQLGRVGHIVLDRAEVSNAFDLPAAHALSAAIDAAGAAAARGEIGAVLLVGTGARFCAGGDVRSFAASDDRAGYLGHLAETLEAEIRRLSELAVPVVVAAHGSVAGAGLALLLNADVVIAARSTRFAMAYAGIGLTPDCGVSYLLPRAVGQQRALDFAVTGRVLSADEAAQWGLVTRVVADEAVTHEALTLCQSMADGAVGAIAGAKHLIRSSWSATRAQSAADEVTSIAAAVQTPEAARLIERFAQPKPPSSPVRR